MNNEEINVSKLDLKDLKILFELDKDSRTSLTAIAKKVRMSKEVVFHRINKLVGRGFITRFQAVSSTYRIGFQSYKIYLKLQDMTKKSKQEMDYFLMKHKSVFWIGHCQGQWDMIVGIWARSIQEFSRVQGEILSELSKNVIEKEVSVSSNNVQFNRRWFYSDNSPVIETTFGEELDPVKIDELDAKILEELSKNSRRKITEISENLKTTIATVIYRIKQMEKNRVIAGYKISLDRVGAVRPSRRCAGIRIL